MGRRRLLRAPQPRPFWPRPLFSNLSGIYYHNDAQKASAEASKRLEQEKHADPIATEIKPASTFWVAEDYHQSYLLKGGQSAKKDDATKIRCYG